MVTSICSHLIKFQVGEFLQSGLCKFELISIFERHFHRNPCEISEPPTAWLGSRLTCKKSIKSIHPTKKWNSAHHNFQTQLPKSPCPPRHLKLVSISIKIVQQLYRANGPFFSRRCFFATKKAIKLMQLACQKVGDISGAMAICHSGRGGGKKRKVGAGARIKHLLHAEI